MQRDEIYDRYELCEKIISLIYNSIETEAYILYSRAGVGKSSVSKKIGQIIEEQKVAKDTIRIISAQDNHNIQEGLFLKNIFNDTKRYFFSKSSEGKKFSRNKFKKYTFGYYIKTQKRFFDLIKVLNDTELSEKSSSNKIILFIHVFKLVLSYISIKFGRIAEMEDRSNYDEKTMCDYLKYILKKGNIIYCIDNTQNFDKNSLSTFSRILLETKKKNNFIILEFTLLDNSSNIDLFNMIKRELSYACISYTISELNNLETKYVLEIAKRNCNSIDDFFETRVTQNYKKLYNGNLKKIEHFASNYDLQISSGSDPTFVKLERLSSNQKYVLAIIILNNAIIKEDILKKILENSREIYLSKYNEDIEYLIRVGFVECRNNIICIKHSDTIDTWNENIGVFKKFEGLAYTNCEVIFSKILENGIYYSLSRKDCILLLFQLYNKFDIIKLNDILKCIDEVIYDIISPDELQEYLKKLIDITYYKESSLNILYNIFEICNRHQLIGLESFCLEKIKEILQLKQEEKFLFYLYTNLLQNEDYVLLLDHINKLKTDNFSIDFQYYVRLFKLVALIVRNNTKEGKQIIDELEHDSYFQFKKQYGYFLRLAEMYDKRNIAIPKVEKSITIFKHFNMDTQTAKSQVSLAFLYSITGELNKAQKTLDAAEKILLRNIENRHVFNINKACLYLLNRNFSEEVWELLTDAEKSAYIKFDCIAIIINKLIWCIQNKRYDLGKYYVKKGLDLLELEYNRHLHAIFNYNCYVLYDTMGDKKEADKYFQLAVKYKEHCDTLKARLEGRRQVEDNTTFLLQYPWHVCFVSFWYFDYVFDLE